jgi:hypothetical protein
MRPQFALERERGRGRRNAEAGDFAEFVDQFFGHAVGERLLVHVVGQVEKGEYGDGFLWLGSNGGQSSVMSVRDSAVEQDGKDEREANGRAGGPRGNGFEAWAGLFRHVESLGVRLDDRGIGPGTDGGYHASRGTVSM